MMFDRIKGQENVITLLKSALANDRISGSYLFQGPDGVGKFTTALYFGMSLNCLSLPEKRPCGTCNSCQKFLRFNHPDLVYIFPTPNYDITRKGKLKSEKAEEEYASYIADKITRPWQDHDFRGNVEIRTNSIRMLDFRASITPNEGAYKVFIIEHADEMNTTAANAFLRTLEEPPADTVIILTTSKPNSLLPTIISRCQQVIFSPLSSQVIEEELIEQSYLDNIDAKMYARIANGNLEKARQMAEKGQIRAREDLIRFLNYLLEQEHHKFIAFSEEFRSVKNQDRFKEVISQLILWVNDLVYLNTRPELIVNLDKDKLLKRFLDSAPGIESKASDLISYLETMSWKLDGHVNAQLILTGIYNRFAECLNIN